MARDKPRPFRYTKGKLSLETTLLIIFGGWVWLLIRWAFRRCKPIAYHPIGMLGLVVFFGSYAVTPWLTANLMWALVAWRIAQPDSYFRHVDSRIQSFWAGFRYRYRPRAKLQANGLLNDKDPIPTISHVHKDGCLTTVRIKMSYGDEIDYWRERAKRIAQTYNAGDCKMDVYRRDNFLTFRTDAFTLRPPFIRREEFVRTPPFISYRFEEKVTKYRWLECQFLTKDPFNSKLGVEFIKYHRVETLEPVVATYRDGQPHSDNLAAHRLMVAMTRWGKSNAVRATIFAHRDNIADKLLEIWMIDGKGGVEGSFLEHQVARHAYGDTERADFDPTEFDELLKDAVTVLKTRQRKMRGFATEHIPTPTAPWLRIIIDEILVLTSKNIDSNIRNSIAANIELIQQQGIACGVSLLGCTQFAQKELLPFRQGFTEFEVGKVERGAVDMLFGAGWWERGARADEIPKDLKGVFYRKTDTTMAPHEIRYPRATDADLRTLRKRPDSVLWEQPDESDITGVLIA